MHGVHRLRWGREGEKLRDSGVPSLIAVINATREGGLACAAPTLRSFPRVFQAGRGVRVCRAANVAPAIASRIPPASSPSVTSDWATPRNSPDDPVDSTVP